MKREFIFSGFAFIFLVCGFAQTANTRTVIIEVTNVVTNGGNIILAIFSSAEDFRREEPGIVHILQSAGTVVSLEVTLPYGEYLVSAFQDANNNGEMDFGLFGIPKELFGITNYYGRGFPSRNFNRHKVPVNSETEKITVGLYKM